MNNQDRFANCASIPPVESTERPQWTVLIPTWNSGRFLGETINSVLAQDPGESQMEIFVVDDHSTLDDPEEITRSVAGGRVRFLGRIANVGKVRNYETGLLASSGRLIHQLHGDDRVLPGFYSAMENAFAQFPTAGAFFCESFYIDEAGKMTGRTGTEMTRTGILDSWVEKIAVQQRIQAPSIVVRREVYEKLGGFDRRLNAAEDWEMWVRIAASYDVGFVSQALAEYRTSEGNATDLNLLSGNHGRVMRSVTRIVDEYLPSDLIDRIGRARNAAVAESMIQLIPRAVSHGGLAVAAGLCRDALSFSHDRRTIYRMLSITVRSIFSSGNSKQSAHG